MLLLLLVVLLCFLANGHLLHHLGLAGGGRAGRGGRGTSLLLEDLPELERLVGGCLTCKLAMFLGMTREEGMDSPAVASICPSGLRQECSTRLSWAGISTLRTRVG